ncbi:MAG: exodeoxyribonuclease I [Gammaproteobacteria bacterium]|nr:exodeoxyribonuclease I [Gammaproteobacteria bacterium]
MKNSYLFYDIETTGLNKCFDQVLQFAAIRTDLDLKEIERHEIIIKLNPDVIPSPTAVLIHGITLEQMHSGVCEYEAMREIHRLFNIPGTITVGYNSLGFDDEFLRFSFYRNLLAPYTHQFANNCSRMDIYPMTVMYYLFKSDVINWPKINDLVTLKLEHLSKHNDLMFGNAHEAMSDVEATLNLARLLKKEQAMWEYLCGCFNKKTDLERLKKLTFIENKYQSGLLIEGNLGGAKFYQSPAIGLGFHQHYKNQSLWLPLDAFMLSEVNANNIATATFVNRKRFGEPPILLPMTERFSRYLSDDRLSLIAANVDWLQKNPGLLADIISYHKGYKYPEIPDLDVDAALYQIGFISDGEQVKCNNFHAADLEEKILLLDSFSSPNLRTQAIRVLGRNYPEFLMQKDSLYEEFMAYLDRIKLGEMMLNYKNEIRLTPQVALAEIDNLRQSKNLNTLHSNLLSELSENLLKKYNTDRSRL